MTILFVDDNTPGSYFLSAILRAHYPSHEILNANEKERTLVIIHNKQPGLVFLNLILYWSNGLALANLIKEKYGRRIRIIIITDHQIPGSNSVDAVLVRPFPIDTLYEQVDSWLNDQSPEMTTQLNNNTSLLVKLRRLLSAPGSR